LRVELLERDAHLAMLDTWLAEVRGNGRGQLVLVAGEAGVGKTAIVRAFGERQRSVAVLAGACEALFTPRPLGPLLDIAGDVGGELAEATERGASAGEVLAALARALRGVSVVVLEDLHWADEATLDVVLLLGRRVARMPALVVVTYRDDELERDHPLRVVLGELGGAQRLTVEPLSPGAVARLAAAHSIDGAALHARTGGNAFFVTEVLARHRGERTPDTVRDAVLARAARLPGRARRLLEAVAVARPRAEVWLLERIATEEVRELEACLASGMLRAEGDAVGFRHEIARATIEDELSPDRHVALHRAALAALVGRAEPARLAHHAEAAGDGAAVLEHSQAAGKRAARLGAHREAAAHFAAALDHADGLEPAARAALLERRSQACFLSGMIQEAVEAETDALEIYVATGNRLREGDAHQRLGLFAWYQGDGPRVIEHHATAIEILETLTPGRELAQAYGRRVADCMMEFDLAGARRWGERAIDLAERLHETEVLAAATCHVGAVELAHGLDEGREKLLRSLQLALDAGLHHHAAVAYCNLVSGSHDIRDYETAVAQLAAGRAFCDEHDLFAWHTYLGGWQAHIALDHGRWAEAAARAGENLDRARGSLPHSRFRSLLVAGLLHARRGEADPWPELDEALGIAVEANELDTLGPVAIARAEARWLAGELDRVAAETDDTLARAERSDHRWLIGELAIWRHRAGLPYAGSERLPRPYRAELAGEAQEAVAFWRARGCGYDAALVLATSDAEEDLRESLRELQGLGARPAAAIVARRLREQGARGVRLGPRAATRANPAGLTARQLDVLALLSRGDRNADIAAKLFLSEKTVDHHVSAILRKLGVRSRGQAAAEAARLGIAGR
jgi:DNA-binding CsgD family transcriptional regulator